MSYSVFRIQGIKLTTGLMGLKKHNKDRVSHTNADIDKTRSKDNITLIECNNYNGKFNEIVAPMKEEHIERMKNMRADRVKTFEQHINSSKNDVACEMIFTSDNEFFKDMNKQEIQKWAEKSLDFATKDLGIDKKNILHAVVHMDEKTPHLHVVAVPLVKTFNKKQKKDVWSISRRQFISGKQQLSELQDTYNKRMNDNGYKLDRGEPGGNKKHTTKIEYVKEQLKALEGDLKAIEAIRGSVSDISNLNYKKSPLGAKISIKECDFNKIMDLAKKGIVNSSKIEKLQESLGTIESKSYFLDSENKNLEKYVQELKDENKELRVRLNRADKTIRSLSAEFQQEYLKTKNQIENPTQKPKQEPKSKNMKKSQTKGWDLER